MYGAHYEASAVDNYRKNDYWAAHLQIDFVVAIICFTANMLFFAINGPAPNRLCGFYGGHYIHSRVHARRRGNTTRVAVRSRS
eukprot:174277-Prymnesium_polylepis.2